MAKADLRICAASCESEPRPTPATERRRLGEVIPLLLCAQRRDSRWLKDLADDEIIITPDLADVLRTIESYLAEKRIA